MANKQLFSTAARTAPATTRNEAGGKAYAFAPKHALAQIISTGCLSNTYYAAGNVQLESVLDLARGLESDYVARAAVYARQHASMKDMPALLLAVLAASHSPLFEQVFDRVCDNGKMLRNFVQIVRSGVTGRRSLGTRPRNMIRKWLAERSDDAIFRASVGNDPSLADIIKLAHPAPQTAQRRALYGYLIGRPYDVAALPELVRRYERFKHDPTQELPDVPFQMLTHLDLSSQAWREIALRGGWQMIRMNLNTFMRHGVFEDREVVEQLAKRLSSPDEIRKARIFPYQLLVAYHQADAGLPRAIREALHQAMEIATQNVPRIDGRVFVLPDISGSMHSPVTGHRPGSTTSVRCIDVAALIAAAVLRNNHEATVIPFHDHAVEVELEAWDTIMTNAKRLASLPSGGTNCSAPLALLNQKEAKGDLVIFVSDNESWIDSGRRWNPGTEVLREWDIFKARNPMAKLVCIDIQPYASTQAPERADILNIGGFSDSVFELVHAFAESRLHPNHWVHEIEQITL